jgi:hypothetical protein
MPSNPSVAGSGAGLGTNCVSCSAGPPVAVADVNVGGLGLVRRNTTEWLPGAMPAKFIRTLVGFGSPNGLNPLEVTASPPSV